MTHETLDFAQRLILANQYRMLLMLAPHQGPQYRQSLEIVQAGYEFLYETLDPDLRTAVVPHSVAKEVCAIFDMHLAFQKSATALGSTANEMGLTFAGFHEEEHSDECRFATFMRRELGRWPELAYYPDRSTDSTCLARYRALLVFWNALGSPAELTKEQFIEIAASV